METAQQAETSSSETARQTEISHLETARQTEISHSLETAPQAQTSHSLETARQAQNSHNLETARQAQTSHNLETARQAQTSHNFRNSVETALREAVHSSSDNHDHNGHHDRGEVRYPTELLYLHRSTHRSCRTDGMERAAATAVNPIANPTSLQLDPKPRRLASLRAH